MCSVCCVICAVFELPVVCWLLGKFGLLSAAWMRRYRRHALVSIMIVAAVITPPDVMSMCLMVLPVYLLYEISILLVKNNT